MESLSTLCTVHVHQVRSHSAREPVGHAAPPAPPSAPPPLFLYLPACSPLADKIDISSDSHFVVPFLLARLVCVERESEEVLIVCLWKQIRFYILR